MPWVSQWLRPTGAFELIDAGAIVTGLLVASLGAVALALAADRLPLEPATPKAIGSTASTARRWPLPAFCSGVALLVLFVRVAGGSSSPWNALWLGLGVALAASAIDRWQGGPKPPRLMTARDFVAMAGLAGFAVALNLVDLTRWDFASIGDEGAFFDEAARIAHGSIPNPFGLSGVYGNTPLIDSIYQGVVMRVFGVTAFGWKLSEVLLVGAVVAITYPLALALLGRAGAVVSCLALGCSQFLMAFARIGYDNPHMLVPATAGFLCLATAWRTQRLAWVFGTGIAAGSALYTFHVSSITVPILALLLMVRAPVGPGIRRVVVVAVFVAAVGIVDAPGLFTMSPRGLFHIAVQNSDHSTIPWSREDIFLGSLFQSIPVFWVNHRWFNHYIGVPLLDPLSGGLFLVGLALAVVNARSRVGTVILAWFGLGLLLITATSFGPMPFFTRLIYLVPACALTIGAAAAVLDRALARSRRAALFRAASLATLVLALPMINLYELLVLSPTRTGATDYDLFVRVMRGNPGRLVYAVRPDQPPDPNQRLLLTQYPDLLPRYRTIVVWNVARTLTGTRRTAPVYVLARGQDALVTRLRRSLPSWYSIFEIDDHARFDHAWVAEPRVQGQRMTSSGCSTGCAPSFVMATGGATPAASGGSRTLGGTMLSSPFGGVQLHSRPPGDGDVTL